VQAIDEMNDETANLISKGALDASFPRTYSNDVKRDDDAVVIKSHEV
jgi:hypothetical protein